jgi:tetratricopeptide (TPR) repeat protein
MKKFTTLRLVLAAAAVGAITVVAWACGGGYEPEGILTMGDYAVISPLRTTFAKDFEKAFGSRLAKEKTEDMPGLDRASVVAGVISAVESDCQKRGIKFDREAKTTHHPLELSLYLASLETDSHEAIPLCERILALPPEQRRNLTAVAHYRIGRLLMIVTDWEQLTPERAQVRMAAIRDHLNATKQAVKDGYPDICLISRQCDGWIAYSQSMIGNALTMERLGLADFGQALRTYLAMNPREEASGRTSALHLIAKLARDGAFASCAKDPDLRKLMTIFICAGGGELSTERRLDQSTTDSYARSWVKALEEAGVQAGDDAWRIANLQYSAGEWEKCAETLRGIPADDPMAALLRSRLSLRNQDVHGAIASLKPAISHGDTRLLSEYMSSASSRDYIEYSGYYLQADAEDRDSWTARARGELGVLFLKNQEYVSAMGAFYYSLNERDAAYVGECLLTVDELKRDVDQNWQRPLMTGGYPFVDNGRFVPVRYEVRHLLARRLFRSGRWEEALPYFPDDVRATARRYVELSRKAERWHFDRVERADAYWRAALIMAKQGDSLIHSDFGHYWRSSESWYVHDLEIEQTNWHERPDLPKLRLEINNWKIPNSYAAPSDDERQRAKNWIKKNLDKPDYSHRIASYAAVDLIMKAVSHLPDNDVRGSQMLQYAGDILKFVDPKAANPAYRTLAIRFRKTPLGSHAWHKHWFSREDGSDDPDLLSK